MSVLQFVQVSKAYGPKVILDDVNFVLNEGDRIALVGANGCGKTTFVRIAMGHYDVRGRVTRPDRSEIGYLPQALELDETLSVRDYIERSYGEIGKLKSRLAALEEQLEGGADVLEEYGEVQEEFSNRGGYTLDNAIEQVLAGLELDHIDQNQPVARLSGGEKVRLALAALLLLKPRLLILDEPTNHLDLKMLDWLGNFLQSYPHTLVLISHDRDLVDQTTNTIVELDGGKLTTFCGNYSHYLAEKQRMHAEWVSRFKSYLEEVKETKSAIKAVTHSTRSGGVRGDSDKLTHNFTGERSDEKKAGRSVRQLRGKLAELEAYPVPAPPRYWRTQFNFRPKPLPSQIALRANKLKISPLFDSFSCELSRGERLVISGPNGCGKSTLLKILAGKLAPDAGEVVVAESAQVGYLGQEQEGLDPTQAIIDLHSDEQVWRTALHSYVGLAGEETKRCVQDLSYGQKQRLILALLIVQGANLLLLDEPTNHIDLLTLEGLEDGLKAFPGAIIAVSHDRRFAQRIATNRLDL